MPDPNNLNTFVELNDFSLDNGGQTISQNSKGSSFHVGVSPLSTGSLIINNLATVFLTSDTGVFSIGVSPDAFGQVTVTGGAPQQARTTLDISRDGHAGATPELRVGVEGTGVLIENHALVRSQWAYIGLHSTSEGTVNINDAGWVAYEIKVGDSGHGILNIVNNAALEGQSTVLGNSGGGVGEAKVDHSKWLLNGTLAVGRDGGVGTLQILNGGILAFTREGSWDLTIGWQTGAGSVLVSGPGSELKVNKDSNFINVGPSGNAELKVSNFGSVITPAMLVGADQGQPSTAIVDVNSDGVVRVGKTLHLRDGTLDVDGGGSIIVGKGSKISKTVYVGANGELKGDGVIKGNLSNEAHIDGDLSFGGSQANLVVNNGAWTGQARLGAGNDIFNGAAGKAVNVLGQAGDDKLVGGSFDDILNGGDDRDVLTGHKGADDLTGGMDKDIFNFDTIKDSLPGGANRDVIGDFKHSQGDRIDVSDIAIKGAAKFTFIGGDDFGGKAGQLRYEDKGSKVIVQGDTNGDGQADFEIHVNAGSLAKGDFIL